jgi:hypothetical protein
VHAVRRFLLALDDDGVRQTTMTESHRE